MHREMQLVSAHIALLTAIMIAVLRLVSRFLVAD
jgi:hypothetical protein